MNDYDVNCHFEKMVKKILYPFIITQNNIDPYFYDKTQENTLIIQIYKN